MTCCIDETRTEKHGPHIGEYCTTCGKWLRWIPQDWRDFVVPFGIHKGTELRHCPDSWIEWSAKNIAGLVGDRCREALSELMAFKELYNAR